MCFKQAGLMQDLRARLINGGFPEVEFRILNTESTVNETSDGLWRLRYMAGHPTIPVLQETPSNFLWHNLLDGAMDHILVLDRCSRLTYQVITPWSILHFPYVKAAILSTYEDDPCGGSCTETLEQNINSSRADDLPIMNSNSTVDENENTSIATNNSAETVDMPSSVESPSSSEQTTDALDLAENLIIEETHHTKATLAPLTERTDGTVPIRVVMHAPHLHRHVNGTVTQHEYLELQTGNPDYHGHLTNDNNIVEQTHKRKKYKGLRRKSKVRSEAIQAETQDNNNNNYENTKLKQHRDKERPEKKKQMIKSDEQNTSEEAAAATTVAATMPLQAATTTEPIEVNTEVEIPQEIQEHYDYRNMPYFKHLHKPAMTVTEAMVEEEEEDTDSTVIFDHSKWTSHPPPTESVDIVVTTESSQQSQDTNTPEDNTDFNLIDTEEHKKYKSNKGGKQMVTVENQPTNNELSIEDDDESKKQVIQHYSQLLKWIHYSLPETSD